MGRLRRLPRYVVIPLVALAFLLVSAGAVLGWLTVGSRVPLFWQSALAFSTKDSSVEPSAAQQTSATPTSFSTSTAVPTTVPTVAPTDTATATATPVPPTPVPGAVTQVPILMYHYIRLLPPNTPDRLGYGLSISPDLFEQQLSYLAGAGYQSISMAQLASHVTHGTPLPPKPIVLSFDDGYADFYSAALPLLRRYHFSATTYLVVNFLNRPGYMTWQQAATLRDLGIEIGAHTLDHVDLARVPPSVARAQIADSRTILRQRLNVPVETFAYPSGRYNTSVLRAVAEAGFTSAVTTNFGDRYAARDLLTLPRIRVPGGISMQAFTKNLG